MKAIDQPELSLKKRAFEALDKGTWVQLTETIT